MGWRGLQNKPPHKEDPMSHQRLLMDDNEDEDSLISDSVQLKLRLDEGSEAGSGTSSAESEGLDRVCQTCVYLCQTDCCHLYHQFGSWESPRIVEGLMFILFFAQGLFTSVTSEYTYRRVWEVYAKDGQSFSGLRDDTLGFVTGDPGSECKYTYGLSLRSDDDSTLPDIPAQVQTLTARMGLMVTIARYIPQIFVALAVGSYTDVIGRKFGLVLPTIGCIIASIVYLVIDLHHLHLKYMLLANVLLGAFGGLACASGCAFAYISETVSEETRTFRFSILASLRFAAIGLSTLCGGYIVQLVGFTGTFWILLLMLVAALIYAIFILPESYTGAKRWRDFNLIALFISSMLAISVYLQPRDKPRSRVILPLLLFISFLEVCITNGRTTVLTIYLLGPPFCSTDLVASLARFSAVVLACIGPFLAKYVIKKRLPDPGVGVVACLTGGLGLAAQGLATNNIILFLSIVLQVFLPMPNAISRSIMSKWVEPEEQGALQAGVASVRALGNILSSVLALYIFAASIETFPGLVFVILGVLNMISTLCFVIVWGLQRPQLLQEQKKSGYGEKVNLRKLALDSYYKKYKSGATSGEAEPLTANRDSEGDDDVFLD